MQTSESLNALIREALARVNRKNSPLEHAKLDTSVTDRLIVIDGAAITVSLSAIGNHHSIYGTDMSLFGKISLEVAWAAFILSIILALVNNWMHVSSYGTLEFIVEARQSLNELEAILEEEKNMAINLSEDSRRSLRQLNAIADLRGMRGRPDILKRKRCGLGAYIATVLGFIALSAFLFAALKA